MNWTQRYASEKEANTAETLGLLTPAAILAQPFISDKINKLNEKKKRKEEEASQSEQEEKE